MTTAYHATPATRQIAASAPSWQAAYRRAIALLRRAEPYGQSALLLSLRLLYGWFFAQTGFGKLMNFERTVGFFESLSLPAPALTAGLVATTELVGGILLAAGFGTRYAAAILSTVMMTAYLTAHADEAFTSLAAFTEQAPFPFLVASLVALLFGAGLFSVDGWFRRD